MGCKTKRSICLISVRQAEEVSGPASLSTQKDDRTIRSPARSDRDSGWSQDELRSPRREWGGEEGESILLLNFQNRQKEEKNEG